MSEVVIPDTEAMYRLGAALASHLRAGDVLVLTGPLGAGKTTLTRGLGEALAVRGTVASPTFVIARTHPSTVGGPALIHVDAYRLNSALELDDLDLDLDASVTVIEWGTEIVSAICDSWLELVIERPVGGDFDLDEESLEHPRRVTLQGVGERWAGFDAAAVLAEATAGP